MPCVQAFVSIVTQASDRPVLIVEDDEPTQRLLQAVLRRRGYDTEIAANGQQAIDMLGARPYTLVLLDVMMPNVGGEEVVAFLVRSAAAIPVIVCSAAGPTALARFEADVVKAIVRKPFDIEQLLDTVADVIEDGKP